MANNLQFQSNGDTLNLAAFMRDTKMVGPGLRDAFWVQGCSIRCKGCANQSYLPHEKRALIPVRQILAHLSLRVGEIDGISLLGGEPTEQPVAVGNLLCGAKTLGITTVLFTGRTYEELLDNPMFSKILNYTDLLIDGQFLQNRKDTNLYWRGSDNQRLIFINHAWSHIMSEHEGVNGEIILSGDKVIYHGIGTQKISFISRQLTAFLCLNSY